MIKYFCDKCETEIDNQKEVYCLLIQMLSQSKMDESMHFCFSCIRGIVKKYLIKEEAN